MDLTQRPFEWDTAFLAPYSGNKQGSGSNLKQSARLHWPSINISEDASDLRCTWIAEMLFTQTSQYGLRMVFCMLCLIILSLNKRTVFWLFKWQSIYVPTLEKILNICHSYAFLVLKRPERDASTATGNGMTEKESKIYSPASCYTQMNIVRAVVPLASCTLTEKPSTVFTEFSELQAFFWQARVLLADPHVWGTRTRELCRTSFIHQYYSMVL